MNPKIMDFIAIVIIWLMACLLAAWLACVVSGADFMKCVAGVILVSIGVGLVPLWLGMISRAIRGGFLRATNENKNEEEK